ncbi:MAG: hypothetical protein ACRDID_01820, partial [Ktedonobacterales bacterium]
VVRGGGVAAINGRRTARMGHECPLLAPPQAGAVNGFQAAVARPPFKAEGSVVEPPHPTPRQQPQGSGLLW